MKKFNQGKIILKKSAFFFILALIIFIPSISWAKSCICFIPNEVTGVADEFPQECDDTCSTGPCANYTNGCSAASTARPTPTPTPSPSAIEQTAADINEKAKPIIQVSFGDLKAGPMADVGYGCDSGTTNAQCLKIDWLGQYISAVYKYAMGLAAILAAVMIMAGGFLWLTSAGDSGRVGKAKEFIVAALSGLFLALFSYMILYTVNPKLVNLQSIYVIQPNQVGVPEAPAYTYTPSATEGIPGTPGTTNTFTGAGLQGNGSQQPNETAADAILRNAQYMMGTPGQYNGQSTADGPGNGTLACVWAVNEIIRSAEGAPPTTSLNTSGLRSSLSGSSDYSLVANPADATNGAQAGDIIVSDQHAGICANYGCTEIISNQTNGNAPGGGAGLDNDYTWTSWNGSFTNTQVFHHN